jgi:hypothetical protein
MKKMYKLSRKLNKLSKLKYLFDFSFSQFCIHYVGRLSNESIMYYEHLIGCSFHWELYEGTYSAVMNFGIFRIALV